MVSTTGCLVKIHTYTRRLHHPREKKKLSSISKVGPGWRASCGVHSGLAPLPWNQPGRYPKLVDVWAHVDKAGKEAGHSVLVKTGDHTPQSKDTTGKGRKRRSRIRTKDGFGRAFVHALSCGFSAGNEGTNSRTLPSGFTPSWTCVPLLGWRRLRGKPIGTHRFAARLRLGAEKSRPRQDPKPHPPLRRSDPEGVRCAEGRGPNLPSWANWVHRKRANLRIPDERKSTPKIYRESAGCWCLQVNHHSRISQVVQDLCVVILYTSKQLRCEI